MFPRNGSNNDCVNRGGVGGAHPRKLTLCEGLARYRGAEPPEPAASDVLASGPLLSLGAWAEYPWGS